MWGGRESEAVTSFTLPMCGEGTACFVTVNVIKRACASKLARLPCPHPATSSNSSPRGIRQPRNGKRGGRASANGLKPSKHTVGAVFWLNRRGLGRQEGHHAPTHPSRRSNPSSGWPRARSRAYRGPTDRASVPNVPRGPITHPPPHSVTCSGKPPHVAPPLNLAHTAPLDQGKQLSPLG